MGSAAERMELVPEPRLGIYVQDRRSKRARRRRLASWFILVSTAFLYGALFAFLPPAFIPALSLPLVLLLLLVIWALPATHFAPTRTMAWLFWAFYIALIVWPNYLAISLPGLPWITLLRISGIPLTLLLLISVSISISFRQELRDILSEVSAVWKLLVAFCILEFLSIPFSRDPFDSASKVFISQVDWTAIFFVSCFIFKRPQQVTRWLYLLAVMVLIVCGIAAWEWRLGHVPWAGHIPSILKIQDESVQRILAGGRRAATGIYRTQSTFSTSLGLAEFLALAAPFIIYLFMSAKRFSVRAGMIVLLIIMFVTILNTDSRLGSVGFFVAILMTTALWAGVTWKRQKRSILAPALLLSYPGLVALFLAATFASHRLHRIVWGGGETQFSTDSRLEQFHKAIPLILRRPFGYGAGKGAEALGFTNPSGTLTLDSYYLTIALEYGLIGFVCYYGMFIAAGVYSFRSMLSSKDSKYDILIPLMVSIAVFIVVKSVFSQQDTHPLVFMILGMVAGVLRHRREYEQGTSASERIP